ncbi:DoxX family protein [Paraflavisolibacter sp. H34]|uniref:DoxX family protein n=1 Tax=Huijunlia imazamoxiresistens TaxID=3127457 RepID=UPI003017A409
MDLIHRVEHWGDTHHPLWMDFVRIALGIFLCIKGIQFLQNMSVLQGMITDRTSFDSFSLWMITHLIVFAHIGGGVLLILGMLTRFACLIQIPILLGAVFFINSSPDVMRPYGELILSIVVLLLLCYFLVAGNGPLSFQWFIDRDQRSDVPEDRTTNY